MSQAGDISAVSGPVPPSVATSYQTQNGTAVPALNVLIVNAVDSIENNNNGVISKGGVVGTGVSNELDIVLTNRQTYSETTTNLQTLNLLTFDCGLTPGVYNFNLQIQGFASATNLGAGYSITSLIVRTTGAAATIIGSPAIDTNEEGALSTVDVVINDVLNTLTVDVTGVAGQTIKWSCLLTYVFLS